MGRYNKKKENCTVKLHTSAIYLTDGTTAVNARDYGVSTLKRRRNMDVRQKQLYLRPGEDCTRNVPDLGHLRYSTTGKPVYNGVSLEGAVGSGRH